MGEVRSNGASNDPNGAGLDCEAVVIGAGIAGLYQLYRLREMGLSVRAFEAGSDVGGTWYWNRYPGARVDSQAYIYQYWFSEEILKEWDWSERFPAQPETERYLNFVADKCDLRKDIQFNTFTTSAHYDEDARHWVITTDQGDTVTTRFLVSCTGMLSAPTVPVPGSENFHGPICHTARWPKEGVDLAGKRVGVIGTGATGIQVIQTIASEVEHLQVFQRTAQYAVPMRNPKYTDADRAVYREQYRQIQERVHNTFAGFDFNFEERSFHDMTPEQRRELLWEIWNDGSLSFWLGGFMEMFFDEEVNEEVSEFVRERIRERVDDPETAEKLIPTSYGFGTHRVPLETNYFEAYNRDNVDLIDVSNDPIERITENGLVTASGAEYAFDVLVLATGFDAGTGALTRIDIRGRDDRSLKADWNREIRSTMGLQVHGYPNLFTVAGPLAPSTAFCNMTTCLQQQVDWVTDTIAYVREHGQAAIEPTAEKEDEWVRHHDELANATLVVKTDSWYMGSNVEGKPRRLLSYIGGVGNYRQICEQVKAGGYQGFVTT